MAKRIHLPHDARGVEEDKLRLDQGRKIMMKTTVGKSALLVSCLMLASATFVLAQGHTNHVAAHQQQPPRIQQVVALDECDPVTFNAALGPDFCKNVALAALGFATTLSELFAEAGNGAPDPGWDFEPDTVKIKEGTILTVVDQGGEPHTFTEVAKFGGGFIAGLNNGEDTVRECEGGFKNVAVAKTRILQGSQTQIGRASC